MDPKLIRKDIKYQKRTLIIVTILVVCLFIGGSFALLSSSSETNEVVSFQVGDLNMEVSTSDTLSLAGELPKSYNEGFKNKDITLTLKNTGSLEIGKYEVKLEGDNTSTLNNKYIKYSVSEDNGTTYLAAKLLSDTNNIIYTGYSLKDTKVLKVKLWIDENADSEVLKKTYNGKIKVELYQNEDTIVDVVKSKLVSNYSGSNESFSGGLVAVNNNGELYHEENDKEIREYRYSGPNVNNYAQLTEIDPLTNESQNVLWRIIGVFKDENNEENVKIVRDEVLPKSYIPTMYEISGTTYTLLVSDSNVNLNNPDKSKSSYYNDWATSGLQYYLNLETDDNNTKGYISFLSNDSRNLLENKKYTLGSLIYNNYIMQDTTIEAFKHERDVDNCINGVGLKENTSKENVEKNGCRLWSGNQATWTGLVSLMYASDYGYSSTSNFWNKKLGNTEEGFKNTNINKTSWMYETMKDAKNNSSWLLSLSSSSGHGVTIFMNSGEVGNWGVHNGVYSVRPSLFLKSNVKITSGDGTSDNPYKLSD